MEKETVVSQESMRQTIDAQRQFYLDSEWEVIDNRLMDIARHAHFTMLDVVSRGGTMFHLADRQFSPLIGSALLDHGVWRSLR